MKIPNLRKKRSDGKRRFLFILIFNIFLTVAFISLAYFHLVSSIVLLICILSVLAFEFLISYKILDPTSIKDYLIICFTEKKKGKTLPNANLITLLGAIILPLLSSIIISITEQAAREQAAKEQAAREQAAREQAAKEQAAKEQAAKEQAAKEQAAKEQAAREQNISIINNKFNDVESLLKINKTYLTEELKQTNVVLHLSCLVFYNLFNYNNEKINLLSNYPVDRYSEIDNFCKTDLKINNEQEIQVIQSLYNFIFLISLETKKMTISAYAEYYCQQILEYDLNLKYFKNSEINENKYTYLKDFRSPLTFYIIYNIIQDTDTIHSISNILKEECDKTLKISMLSSEPLYSKFRNFVNLKGPKFKEYTHPRNSREALDNIYFHIEEYIANYFRTYFHLNIYMQNKFHLNIQDILFNQKTCL